jgi:glycolate oxidase
MAHKQEIVAKLRAIVGDDNVSTNTSDIITYHTTSDIPPGAFSDIKGIKMSPENLARAVVRPSNSHEISEIVRLANNEKIPLRLVSAGTALNGAINPKTGEIILDLHRMNWMRIHEEDGYVEIGPAANIMNLDKKLEPLGYVFPCSPGSKRIACVAGVIAINSSGHSVDSHAGKPGNYVLGLEVVLPTGEIIETGTKTLRQMAGPDLTRFFIGSEGHFGIITNIFYRLVRKPKDEAHALAVFPSVVDCAKVAQRILQDRDIPYPVLFEVMYEFFTEHIFIRNGILKSPGATIMLATDGEAPGEAEWKLEKILGVFREMNPLEIRVVEDPNLWKEICFQREAFSRSYGRHTYAGAVGAPLSKLPQVYERLTHLGSKINEIMGMELDFGLRGHVGGPCCHPGVTIPGGIDEETTWKLIREMRRLTIDAVLENEASWGEQGIFPNNARLWLKKYGMASYKLLRSLKRTFDPNNILNPGCLPELEEAERIIEK